MSAIMQRPQFQMNMAMQPQILRFEDSFEEAKHSGVDIQEEVNAAVILKCLSGQLKTNVSLQLGEKSYMPDEMGPSPTTVATPTTHVSR